MCVTFTHGEAGVYDPGRWPASSLGDTREQELGAGLRELGVERHYLFDYPDGRCAEADPQEALRRLHHLIDAYAPDTILTFGPEGLTGHTDHQAISAWVDTCVRDLPRPPRVLHAVVNPAAYRDGLRPIDEKIDLFFNIDTPPLVPDDDCAFVFVLPPEILDQKCRALAAMPSQTGRIFSVSTPEQIRKAFGVECFVDDYPNRK